MGTEDVYWEANRRNHRLLGCYLVLSAWQLKVDCVVLERKELMTFLGLKRAMQNKRIDRLARDVQGSFPHAQPLFSGGKTYSTLYLSRAPFPDGFPWGRLKTPERVARLNENNLKTTTVPIPTEKELVSTLALITHGLEGVNFHPRGTAPARTRRLRRRG